MKIVRTMKIKVQEIKAKILMYSKLKKKTVRTCTNSSNTGNSWRGPRGGGQQQVRGGARYQPQQQRDGGSYSRGNGGYRGRGIGQRGRGSQQRQDRQNAGQETTTFTTR